MVISNTNKILYLASLDKQKSPGVWKKIMGTLEGFQQEGYQVASEVIDPSPGFLKKISASIDQMDEDILIIRSLCQYNFYLIPAFIRARIKGKKIIVDVPTPNSIAIIELAKSNAGWFRKLKDLSFLIISGPIPFWFTNRVLQYAKESWWFSLGNRAKTLFIGNGIQTSAIPQRPSQPDFDGTKIKLICVASLNYWHGVDRLIKSIGQVNRKNLSLKIYLNVIGEGASYQSLKDLTSSLDLGEYIKFLGFRNNWDLYKEYEKAHLAVGSLALFRKNLQSASELKSREYCAVGIPFLVVGDDPDFPKNTFFRFQLPNRENLEDIVEFLENLEGSLVNLSIQEIRTYAVQNLDFKVKAKQMLEGL